MYQHHNTAGCGPGFRRSFRGSHPFYQQQGPRRPKYNVPLNIIDQETEFIVQVYAVGFAKEDIRIAVTEDVLYISGSRQTDEKPEFSWQEFPIKNFERTLNLNGKVKTDEISARSQDGVLIVTLPKNEKALKKEQTITVS